MTTGGWSTPSIRGIEKPQTSASTTPTLLPRCARATARLVVTDDLPTPPLPEAMSSTRVRQAGSANGIGPALGVAVGRLGAGGGAPGSPWSSWRTAARSSSVITVKSTSTRSTPSRAVTASVTRWSISARSGQPATVRAIWTWTLPPSMAMPLTMPRSTMVRCSSGSWTGRRASMTRASVDGHGVRNLPGAWGRAPLSTPDFSSAVTAITSAFGDPTRRDIYLCTSATPSRGVTAVRGGRALRAAPQRRPPPPRQARRRRLPRGVDRPQRRPAPAGRRSATGSPSGRWRSSSPSATTTCSSPCSAGRSRRCRPARPRRWPRRSASSTAGPWRRPRRRPARRGRRRRPLVPLALHAVADALTAHGFAAHAESRDGRLRIISEHCPFGDAAIEHPVICAVDRGMVQGHARRALRRHRRRRPRRRSPLGDAVCVTDRRVTRRGTTSTTRRPRRCGPRRARRCVAALDAGSGDPGRVHAEGLDGAGRGRGGARGGGRAPRRRGRGRSCSPAAPPRRSPPACWGAAERGRPPGASPRSSTRPCGSSAEAHGDVTVVGVDATGRVDPDELLGAVRPDTALVHVQWGNHEVGTLQPVAEVVAALPRARRARARRRRPGRRPRADRLRRPRRRPAVVSAPTSSAGPPAPARCSSGAACGCARCSSAATRSGPAGPGWRTCPPSSASAPRAAAIDVARRRRAEQRAPDRPGR